MLTAFDPADINHLQELELHAQRAGNRAGLVLRKLIDHARETENEQEELAEELNKQIGELEDEVDKKDDEIKRLETQVEQLEECYTAALRYIETLRDEQGALPYRDDKEEQISTLNMLEECRATYSDYDIG